MSIAGDSLILDRMIRDDRLVIRMIRDLMILIRSFGHSHSLILVGGRDDVAICERTIYDLRFLPTMAMRMTAIRMK